MEDRTLKTVKRNGLVISAKIKDNTMWVEWNKENGERWRLCAEWFNHIKSNLYSTYTEWDELDFALESLGVKKVNSKSYISDWGDGDMDVFINSVYDFSAVF